MLPILNESWKSLVIIGEINDLDELIEMVNEAKEIVFEHNVYN